MNTFNENQIDFKVCQRFEQCFQVAINRLSFQIGNKMLHLLLKDRQICDIFVFIKPLKRIENI